MFQLLISSAIFFRGCRCFLLHASVDEFATSWGQQTLSSLVVFLPPCSKVLLGREKSGRQVLMASEHLFARLFSTHVFLKVSTRLFFLLSYRISFSPLFALVLRQVMTGHCKAGATRGALLAAKGGRKKELFDIYFGSIVSCVPLLCVGYKCWLRAITVSSRVQRPFFSPLRRYFFRRFSSLYRFVSKETHSLSPSP